MSEERFRGAYENVAGKVQQAAGALTGDEGLKAEGAVREAGGKALGMYGEALDCVRDFARRKPATAVAIGAVAGAVLLAWCRRDRD
ncbi:uncharacterized protein YjbJ (UPF0337 family) [Luteibacter sp. Sphag1AF]|uniref:CsbD family protein n=1 Tax=Luteibacter sp. Sphag1AF TaxID=2587031 RepID=UPI00161131D8|nr:CsbD family protein [Luteibacter sp. Sphag1AF]MBB3226867.1 uncharacterized protein YjbJ (UPF0337 family) [Luteibacter sp. Sphag1AF]